jgi:hypothetical protein
MRPRRQVNSIFTCNAWLSFCDMYLVGFVRAGAAFHSQSFGGRTITRIPASGTPFETCLTHVDKLKRYQNCLSCNSIKIPTCNFHCQVEVFHLKQRLQTLEGRSGTPTKQHHNM